MCKKNPEMLKDGDWIISVWIWLQIYFKGSWTPQRTTVRGIISKWKKERKKKTQHIAKLPRLADLLKFLQKHIDGSSRKSQKTQRQHRRSCSFSCINKGHCSYIHNPILAKKDIHGRVVRRKPLLTQKNTEALLNLMMKNIPWWSFWENVL